MTELNENHENGQGGLLQAVRKRRLKYISILPSIVTLMNGICGFAAVVFAAHAGRADIVSADIYGKPFPYFTAACYMIFLAMLADMLDGRIARISKSTSSFGGQLDSMCDVVSFGMAPAFLMLKFMEGKINFNPAFNVFVYRFFWLAGAIYLGCAAIRLARFNVENEEDESSHNSFLGLPSPAAAAVVASFIILHQYLIRPDGAQTLLSVAVSRTITVTLPFITVGLAVLMISRIRYPHLVNIYLRGQKPFSSFLWTIAAIYLIIYSFEIASAIIFFAFASSGVVKWLYGRRLAHKNAVEESESPPVAISQ
ncbi:MAG: CDP-diacylglycerol--serine O-phosphatidyltransferase [Sedimentisphaerales bacterium]|nr:CDP-diacylglycerol--serine O-phosphatidyltransferase [Sedimentisphaerales bacterium]